MDPSRWAYTVRKVMSTTCIEMYNSIAPPQLLRFAAHMGLFLHALGRTGNVMDGDPADLPSADGIIIAYIRHLISTQQVFIVDMF